jgi:hypothetical protein
MQRFQSVGPSIYDYTQGRIADQDLVAILQLARLEPTLVRQFRWLIWFALAYLLTIDVGSMHTSQIADQSASPDRYQQTVVPRNIKRSYISRDLNVAIVTSANQVSTVGFERECHSRKAAPNNSERNVSTHDRLLPED